MKTIVEEFLIEGKQYKRVLHMNIGVYNGDLLIWYIIENEQSESVVGSFEKVLEKMYQRNKTINTILE